MFYTDYIAYPYLPGKKIIEKLLDDEYTVIIHEQDLVSIDKYPDKVILKDLDGE